MYPLGGSGLGYFSHAYDLLGCYFSGNMLVYSLFPLSTITVSKMRR